MNRRLARLGLANGVPELIKELRQHRFTRPVGSTEILLVRHGESSPANPDKSFPLVNGHGDPELHPDGIVQAQQVADRLINEPIEAIYVSNLRRTALTAEPLASRKQMQPTVIDDLREVFLGDWEGGLYRTKVEEKDPLFLAAMAEERWDRIPNAESNEAFEARLLGAIRFIASRHADAMVAAFVHGAVIGQIVASVTGARAFAFLGAENGSITRIVVTERRIILRSFNDVAHLK